MKIKYNLSASNAHPPKNQKNYFKDFKPYAVKSLKKLGKLMETHAVCPQQFKEPASLTGGKHPVKVKWGKRKSNIQPFDGPGCIFFDIDNKDPETGDLLDGPVTLSEIEKTFKDLGYGCVILPSKSSKQSWEKFHVGAFLSHPPGDYNEWKTLYKNLRLSPEFKHLNLDRAMDPSTQNMSPALDKKIISIVKGKSIDLGAFRIPTVGSNDSINTNTGLEGFDALDGDKSYIKYDKKIHFLHLEDTKEKLTKNQIIDMVDAAETGYVRCGCHNSKSHGTNDGGAFCNKTDSGKYFYYCNGCREGLYITRKKPVDKKERSRLRKKYKKVYDTLENDLLIDADNCLEYLDNSVWDKNLQQILYKDKKGRLNRVPESKLRALWVKTDRDLTPPEYDSMKEALLLQYYGKPGKNGYTTVQKRKIINDHRKNMLGSLVNFLIRERQYKTWTMDNTAWDRKSGLDYKNGRVIDRDYHILPSNKKYTKKYNPDIVNDYKKHYGKKGEFDQFLDILVAHRFGHGLREAFYWIQATSGWGKSFLFYEVFQKNLKIAYNMDIEKLDTMLAGRASGIKAESINGSWIILFDEFKKLAPGIKNIISSIDNTEKYGFESTIPVYTKIFTSADSIPGLGSGGGTAGVEAQYSNRFNKIDKTQSGRLMDRKITKKYKETEYIDSITKYIYQYLDRKIKYYFKLGRKKSDKIMMEMVRKYNKKYTIKNVTESRNENIEKEGRGWLKNYLNTTEVKALAEAGIFYTKTDGFVIHKTRVGSLKDTYLKSFEYADMAAKMGDIKRAPESEIFGYKTKYKKAYCPDPYYLHSNFNARAQNVFVLNIFEGDKG